MAVTSGAFTRGGRTPIGRMMWKQLQQKRAVAEDIRS